MMYFMAFKGLSYVYYSFYKREATALLIIQMLDGTHGYRKTYHSSSVCKWQNILFRETFPKIKWGNYIQIPWLGSLILKRCFIKIKVWIQTCCQVLKACKKSQ